MKTMGPHSAVEHRDQLSVNSDQPKSKLALIAAKARSNPAERFNSLMHHVTPELIAECLEKIPLNSAAGVDGMNKAQARRSLTWILPPIMEQIYKGQYQAPAIKRVYIPKSNGGLRPLGIPGIVDRAIQSAVVCVLNEIYEQDFQICSFGFRPNLSCHHALVTLKEIVDWKKLNLVLEVDIRDFFGSISHEWLMKFLGLRVGDGRMLKLIEGWLKASVMEAGQYQQTEKGTPQGGSISPLLANIYLHYVLDLWFERKLKKSLQGQAYLVRYADDFVMVFSNQQDREDTHTLLKTRLAQFGLQVAEEKTHMTDMSLRTNKGQDRRHMNFLGFVMYRQKLLKGSRTKFVFQTDKKKFARSKQTMKEKIENMMHLEFAQQTKAINSSLVGFYNYFGIAGNAKSLDMFRHSTLLQWRRTLSRRSQKGSKNWAKMNQILEDHVLAQPCLRVRYEDLRSYVRL